MSATKRGNVITVSRIPDCELCRLRTASGHGRTRYGYWANMCAQCLRIHATGRVIVIEQGEPAIFRGGVRT